MFVRYGRKRSEKPAGAGRWFHRDAMKSSTGLPASFTIFFPLLKNTASWIPIWEAILSSCLCPLSSLYMQQRKKAALPSKEALFLATNSEMSEGTFPALTLVPMMCSVLLENENKSGKLYHVIFDPINRFLDKVSAGYSRLISWCMKHKRIVLLGAVAVFALVLLVYVPNMKTEFIPQGDQGRLSATIELPIGTSQDVTRDVAARIYERIKQDVPEIEVLSYTFGQADSDNAFASMRSNGTYLISMNINVGSKTTRKRTTSEIADVIRADLRLFPELNKYNVSEGMGAMGGASSVALEIYGYDFESTEALAKEVRQKMFDNENFTQVILSRDQYTPEYQIDFDRQKLALAGLSSTTAAAAFSAAISGTVGSFYRENGEEYNIRVRYAPEFRSSIEDMENIVIYNAMGNAVRIKDLGTVVEDRVPPTIQRKNRERLITVTGVVARGHALSEAVAATQAIMDSTIIPSDLSYYIGGDYEDQQEMFGDMILLIFLIIILVYMVMASQFESFMGPFVIMSSIPFAFVGVALGAMVHNMAISIMAMVGIMILLGIVVKNGIVLIDYTILCQERGMSVREASVTAAKSRLRPILMTTLTTVLGMVPLAFGRGEGSEMWNGLGVVVMWGLSISTLITLVIIPTLYCGFTEHRAKRKARKAARKAQAAS